VPVGAFERVKNVPPQRTQFWKRRVIEIAAVDHSDLFHDSSRTSVRLHSECDHCVKVELAKAKLQSCKRAFGGQSLTPKTRNEAVQEFDSRGERHVGCYPFQTQNTGKVASDIESPWSKSVGVPMLLDVRHLAVGFLRSKEPGKVFPYAEIAVHFYESVAVLGHEAPKHRSLLCAAHHPMLAFNRAKRRSVYTLKLTVCRQTVEVAGPRSPETGSEELWAGSAFDGSKLPRTRLRDNLGKADSPIDRCSRLLTTWRFCDNNGIEFPRFSKRNSDRFIGLL
jgi:hypothetical protein